MSKHILLIDGNSIAHANQHASPLTVGDMQVQAIFGTLRSLRALLEKTPGEKELVVLWDGKAQWRIDMFPEYKGNRQAQTPEEKRDREAFDRQTPYIEKALELLGVKQVRSPLLEADDLAGFFVRSLAPRGIKITLVSGDKDWLSLIRPGVSWFDPIRDRRIDDMNFLDGTGYFDTDAFVEGKAMQGDTSDNIDGIEGVGKKTPQTFLAKWGSVRKFWAAVDSGAHVPASRKSKDAKSPHPEQIMASPEGRALIERNIKLMDLRLSRSPEQGEVIIKQSPANPEGFIRLCERLAFASILRERHSFLRTFGIEHVPVAA